MKKSIAVLAKYNLLFTKRSLIILYTFGALFGLSILILSTAMVLVAYANGEGFDVSTENFYYSEIVLYVPFFTFNGYLLRLLVERWRVYRRSKKMFHIAEYDAPKGFTPAHAGLLIDNDIRAEEVIATLYDLQRRGVLTISANDITLNVTSEPVTVAEKRLIDILFRKGSIYRLSKTNASLFLTASHVFREAMLAEMRQNHLFPMPSPMAGLARKALVFAFVVYSYVTVVLLAYLIANPDYIVTIQYPRYSMEIGQPILAVLILMLVLIIAFSGFITSLFTKEGRLNWRLAAGYRLYVETVFKGKFDFAEQAHVSKEQREILPYAIAFSIEKRPVQDFVGKLGL